MYVLRDLDKEFVNFDGSRRMKSNLPPVHFGTETLSRHPCSGSSPPPPALRAAAGSRGLRPTWARAANGEHAREGVAGGPRGRGARACQLR